VGQLLVHDDGALSYVGDHLDVLWQVPISVAILALFYAVVAVAVASLTDRRIVGGLAFLGVLIVPSIVAGAVGEASEPEGTLFAAVNLLRLPLVLRDIVFEGHVGADFGDPLSGVSGAGLAVAVLYVAVIGACLWLLHRRYEEAA
jgi:hypothetical protein